MKNLDPSKHAKTRYSVTLSAAEWAALCICANTGATYLAQSAVTSKRRDTVEDLLRYTDGAVKIIHAALPTASQNPGGAP